nr:collagen alpha-1(I) chain-like [Equus asinus]
MAEQRCGHRAGINGGRGSTAGGNQRRAGINGGRGEDQRRARGAARGRAVREERSARGERGRAPSGRRGRARLATPGRKAPFRGRRAPHGPPAVPAALPLGVWAGRLPPRTADAPSPPSWPRRGRPQAPRLLTRGGRLGNLCLPAGPGASERARGRSEGAAPCPGGAGLREGRARDRGAQEAADGCGRASAKVRTGPRAAPARVPPESSLRATTADISSPAPLHPELEVWARDPAFPGDLSSAPPRRCRRAAARPAKARARGFSARRPSVPAVCDVK